MDVLWLGFTAFFGGIIAALIGWLESSEPFDGRKFGRSILKALVAGIGIGVSYQILSDNIQTIDLLYAFLAGAGVDVLGNRGAGAVSSLLKR